MIDTWKFPWGRIEPVPANALQRRARAYDWRGQAFRWQPSLASCQRTAFDAERLDTPLPELLKPSGMTACEFFASWTRAEALAKYFDVPILAWLRQYALTPPRLGQVEVFRKDIATPVATYTALWPQKQLIFTSATSIQEISL